jgi:hypothetical protein
MPTLHIHDSGWRLRALILACAVLGAGSAWSEPADLPELADDAAAQSESEAVLPEGEPLDLSTPTAEEMRGMAKHKTAKPFTAEPRNDLEAKAGVDYRKPAIPAAEFRTDHLLGGTLQEQSPGVAGANVTTGLPLAWDKASIDTRLDPSQEQGKVGTTLSRSLPLGDTLSLTLQNGLAVSRTLANPALPGSAPAAPQSWSSSQAVRFNILPSDTTVSLGASLSSTDEKWLRTLSAEQKLFGGPFSVTGSVSETASGDASKSLRAGFKRTW